jgi:hypothetical protein
MGNINTRSDHKNISKAHFVFIQIFLSKTTRLFEQMDRNCQVSVVSADGKSSVERMLSQKNRRLQLALNKV